MDSASGELDEGGVLAAARASMLAEKRAGCDLLMAARWADLHPSDSVMGPGERLEWYGEDAVLFGGDGTPDVAETAAGALGCEIGMNPDQARNLIADALDARDRMPVLWTQVRFGRVRRDTVHRVAYRTRHLSKQQAEDVDRHLSASLPRLSPGQRLDHLLDAEIRRVDQERLEQQAAAAVRDRYVRKGRPDDNGMTDLFIRTTEVDARSSFAAVTALAKILQARKDCLPAGVAVRGAGDGDPLPGTDGLDEWRAVAAHLLQTNPGLAVRIQLEAQQPGLFDQAADQAVDTITHLGDAHAEPDQPHQDAVRDHAAENGSAAREAVIADLVTGMIKQLDLTKLQPSAVLHLHICEESLDGPHGPADPQARLARVEGLGPLYLDTIRQWLGQACTVKLQPVIDTGSIMPVDRYEIPASMRETLLTLSPASRFPWSNSLNRRNDVDHAIPYVAPDRGGPPGQTGPDNLGPLTRREHRHKTFGRISVRQPDPDTRVWRTSYGRVLIVNPSGTYDLGTGNLARTLWAALDCDPESVMENLVRRALDLIA